MVSEFAGARLRQLAKNVMRIPENRLARPVRRQHARFTVMWWRRLTLIRSAELPFARVGERAVLLAPQACMSVVARPRKNSSGILTKFSESRRIRPEFSTNSV